MTSIFAGVNGFLDNVPLNKISDFEEQFQVYLEKNYKEISQSIVTTQKIDDAIKAKLEEAIKSFMKVFA